MAMGDPLQHDIVDNIINVHWQSGWIAVGVRVRRTWSYGGPEQCDPEESYPELFENWEISYLTTVRFMYAPIEGVFSVQQFFGEVDSGNWGGLDGNSEVSGLKSLPIDYGYGGWDKPAEARGALETQIRSWPGIRWIASGGLYSEGPYIPQGGFDVPDKTKKFYTTTNASAQLFGNIFTGAAGICYTLVGGPPGFEQRANFKAGPVTRTYDEVIQSESFSFGGLNVTVAGIPYEVIGARPDREGVWDINANVLAPQAAVLWLLCRPRTS